MSELPGQMPLFRYLTDAEYVGLAETWMDYEPLCVECGTACTSSKECVEISGLYDQYGVRETW